MYQNVMEELRKAYDVSALEREGVTVAAWKQAERQDFFDLLKQERKAVFIEIGAGTGKDSKFFQDQGLQVVCTDLSLKMVQLCRAKGLEAHVMDFLNLDFPDAHFDAVYALNCLLHVPKADLPTVLTAIRRIMKPSGLFFMGVYGGYDSEGIYEDDYHTPKRFYSLYPDGQLKKIVRNTFDIHDFKTILLPDLARPDMHFQRLILRKV